MKTIPLSRGYVALVDDADYERVSQFEWHAQVRRRNSVVHTVYAKRTLWVNGTAPTQLLHRFIMGVTDPGIKVDHEDHDGLNCQRYNLRVATISQNTHNQRLSRRNTTGFKGVHRVKYPTNRPWAATINFQNKRKHLGYHSTPELAAQAYDEAALELHGEFALTNTMLGLLAV
jgi:AP2 domain